MNVPTLLLGVTGSVGLRIKKVVQVLAFAFGILLLNLPAFSQSSYARILGGVFDKSGGAIVGATLTITDVQRGISRTLTTDAAGEYNAPDLLPGTYKLRAEVKGFQAQERQNILLEVGHEVRVDLVLLPGEQNQTITVTESLPMVETTNAVLGGSLDNETLNSLPLNGRNYRNLLDLRPGMVINPGGGGLTRSANGLHVEQNSTLVEGLLGVDPQTGEPAINDVAQVGDAATMVPIDAIQEFTVQQNPKAENGWKGGSSVNMGLKSGTNSLHGTAYAFGRDGSWDARNFFNTPPEADPPAELEQFGVTAGGPIKKDHLFWFAAYEGQRSAIGNQTTVTTPAWTTLAGVDPNAAQDSFFDACEALLAKGKTINALSAQLAGLNPTTCVVSPVSPSNENIFPNPGNTTSYLAPINASQIQIDNGLGKLDYHINDHNELSGTYFYGKNSGPFSNQAPVSAQWDRTSAASGFLATASWTWTPNSSWVNELRGGDSYAYNSVFCADGNINPALPWPQGYGINTGVTNPFLFGFTTLNITSFSAQYGCGTPNRPYNRGPNGSYEVLDHISYLRGKHAFKFGGEISDVYTNGQNYNQALGVTNFTSLQNFLTGNVSKGSILSGNPLRNAYSHWYSGFVQDDWRVTTRLTVNLGVRYEYTSPINERHGLLGGFNPVSGLVQLGYGLTNVFDPDHNNFSPRLGFAWDVFGNGKTVLRGGGSVIYDTPAFNVFSGTYNDPTGALLNGVPGPGSMNTASVSLTGGIATTPPNPGAINWSLAGPVYPSSANPTCTTAKPCNVTTIDPNLRTPYVSTWTLGVERSITNNMALDITYVGNRATKIPGLTDLNQPSLVALDVPALGGDVTAGPGWTAASLQTCIVTPTAGNCAPSTALEQTARQFDAKFPYLKYINEVTNNQFSTYNAVSATLTQRKYHGLTSTIAYTYSHSLDTSSTNNAGMAVNSLLPKLAYGDGLLDIPHRFTVSLTYDIPGIKSPGQLLQGWEISTLASVQSGQPWSPSDTSDDFIGTGEAANPSTYGDTWDFFGNKSAFTSGQQTIAYYSSASTGAGAAVYQTCVQQATALGPASLASLAVLGCYAQGGGMLLPPGFGQYSTAARGIFFSQMYANWDMSVTKNWIFRERLTAQFRGEFFNILNHPNFANPGGLVYANNNPTANTAGGFGCACVTPDVGAGDPLLGSGGPRRIQLGLKLIF